jgi:hypothetical protein
VSTGEVHKTSSLSATEANAVAKELRTSRIVWESTSLEIINPKATKVIANVVSASRPLVVWSRLLPGVKLAR